MTTLNIRQNLYNKIVVLGKEPIEFVNVAVEKALSEKVSCDEFEEAQVPDTGRIRLTKAAGKTIEWRIKK